MIHKIHPIHMTHPTHMTHPIRKIHVIHATNPIHMITSNTHDCIRIQSHNSQVKNGSDGYTRDPRHCTCTRTAWTASRDTWPPRSPPRRRTLFAAGPSSAVSEGDGQTREARTVVPARPRAGLGVDQPFLHDVDDSGSLLRRASSILRKHDRILKHM